MDTGGNELAEPVFHVAHDHGVLAISTVRCRLRSPRLGLWFRSEPMWMPPGPPQKGITAQFVAYLAEITRKSFRLVSNWLSWPASLFAVHAGFALNPASVIPDAGKSAWRSLL